MTASSGQTESRLARAAKIAGVIFLYIIGAIVIGGAFGGGLMFLTECEDGACMWLGLGVYAILAIGLFSAFSAHGGAGRAIARTAKTIGAIALFIAGAFVVGLAMHTGCDNENWAWLGLAVYAILAFGIFYWVRVRMSGKKTRAIAYSVLVLVVGGFPGLVAFTFGVFFSNGMCRLF
ncbi:MAG TPA: hypothetical protein VI113_00460 [Alphaproteobacteria bacterium]